MIDLFNTLSFFEVGAPPTGMVYPFRKTVFYCCTRSMLAQDAATVAMSGRAGESEYVVAGVGAEAGHGTSGARGSFGMSFPTVCCLEVCLSAAAAVISKAEISKRECYRHWGGPCRCCF